MMKLYTDGGARGNPGPAAFGFVIFSDEDDREPIHRHGEKIGKNTNNVAEYRGLIEGLKECRRRGIDRILCFSDSQLLVNQVNGLWRVKHPGLRPYHEDVASLKKCFKSFSIAYVPREFSKIRMADKLVNMALDNEV